MHGAAVDPNPTCHMDVTWKRHFLRHDIFDPSASTPTSPKTITFQARMLDTYRDTGDPTVAGDSFTNTVSLQGTTTPITGGTSNPGLDGGDDRLPGTTFRRSTSK